MKGMQISMKSTLLYLALFALCCTPSSAEPKTLYTFDLTYTFGMKDRQAVWDQIHFVSTLQGIVNRSEPNLYVFYNGAIKEDKDAATDHFWLKEMQKSDFLREYSIVPVKDIETLAHIFNDAINGLVVYDGKVPATSNVASTVAGVENLAAIRHDPAPGSLFHKLTIDPSGPKLPIKRWLLNRDGSSLFTGTGTIPGTKTPSTGSAKCDAYIWAKEKYLDTGKCDPRIMGYYVDAFCVPRLLGNTVTFHTLTNHDYIVAKKGFVFDLSPWDDETPIDDPGQKLGTDCATMQAILRSAYTRLKGREMVCVAGYIPLWFKYTNISMSGGKHDPVYCEFRYAGILSSYNAYMDADAIDKQSMANASIFCKYPLKQAYKQKKPTLDDLRLKGYINADGSVAKKAFVGLYIGDYDSSAWMYQMLPKLWKDPARGTIPLGWAFNPNLAQRFPLGMDYARANASPNDHFITGASGAGYLHPGYLLPPGRISDLPSGVDTWKRHNKRWLPQFDISVVGFILDGYAPVMKSPDTLTELWDAYTQIAPDGIAGQNIQGDGVYKGIPYISMEYQHEMLGRERSYGPVEQKAYDDFAGLILRRASKAAPSFAYYRTILWYPSEVKTLMDTVKRMPGGNDVEFVDPYTLMMLIRQFHTTNQRAEALGHGIWEIGTSVEITGHSGVVDGYDIRDLFGRGFGQVESKAVAFKDGVSEPFTHWVEWKTTRPVRVDVFNLFARGDKLAGREDVREFKSFRLYGKRNLADEWTQLDSFTPSHPYDYNLDPDVIPIRAVNLKEPFTGSYFRAEFDQYDSKSESKRGPRITEIEGIGSVIK
ncbi:MAG: GxGYxYP domain-containing protein [Armatimonadota bacterium]